MPYLPLRLEANTTALLSAVQSTGTFDTLWSSVRRRGELIFRVLRSNSLINVCRERSLRQKTSRFPVWLALSPPIHPRLFSSSCGCPNTLPDIGSTATDQIE